MVELREARRIAARTGLGLQYVLKEARIFDVWETLSPILISENVTSEVTLICKGGTVLNKVYLSGTQRFSEDIDFDAFFKKEISRREKIAFLDEDVMSILKKNYEIETPRLMKDVVRFTCKFTNETGAKDCIFVEFNIEPKGTSDFIIKEAKSELLTMEVEKIPAYPFPVIVAKKLKAFYERGSGKDLYDIYYSLRITKNISDVIRALKGVLTAENIIYKEFTDGFLTKLRDKDAIRRVHASTNPYIPRKLRVDWIKIAEEIEGKLKDELESGASQLEGS